MGNFGISISLIVNRVRKVDVVCWFRIFIFSFRVASRRFGFCLIILIMLSVVFERRGVRFKER